MARLNSLPDTVNPEQMLFGIDQGGVFNDIRIDHAKRISELDLDGYAVGGLAVGETHEEMYDVLDNVVPYLPKDKPTYLMGVGTPANIYLRVLTAELISSTVYILQEMAVTDMYILSSERLTFLMQSMKQIQHQLKKAVDVHAVRIIQEHM